MCIFLGCRARCLPIGCSILRDYTLSRFFFLILGVVPLYYSSLTRSYVYTGVHARGGIRIVSSTGVFYGGWKFARDGRLLYASWGVRTNERVVSTLSTELRWFSREVIFEVFCPGLKC